MLRHLALAAAVLALLGLPVRPVTAADQVVRIYNWSDYIDATILDDFTETTGIAVVYDTYDNNAILETKLLAGGSGYDLVFPTASFFARQIKAGVYRPLDRGKLTNWGNLDPEIMRRVERYDPGNAHGVVYMWGTTGIAFNEEMIRQRMADAPVDSWRMIFEPAVVGKFADCGIIVMDAEEELIPAALNYLGLDPDSKDPAVIAKAEPVLAGMRPFVRKFHSSESINAIANGDICLAVMYSGDALQAATRAEEAGKPFAVEYRIPREGALMWFDVMAVPKDAPHPQAAHAFIDFLMRPEIIARATNFTTYANANAAAKPFVDPEILNDPQIYPPPAVQAKLFTISPYDQRTQRIVTRLWQKVKTGN
jgi:putrescine transport system substrate-binding protein